MNKKYSSNKLLQAIFKSISVMVLGLACLSARADGTETLGPPSIPIASGSGIVAAGTGLENSAIGFVDIDAPGNAVQVLLYWEGAVSANQPSDNTLLVNGTGVTGALIGGPTFFERDGVALYHSSYRADVTGLGLDGLVEITGLDNKDAAGIGENNGASLLVIYDDGTADSEIIIRDGSDLAFGDFLAPLDQTVPQTFPTTISLTDRVGNVIVMAAGVDGPGEDSILRITSDGPYGTTTEYFNPLKGGDGARWDSVDIPVVVPAKATSLKIRLISGTTDATPTGGRPASFNWVGAALSISSSATDARGCTPGYWKQPRHFREWNGYTPDMNAADVLPIEGIEGSLLDLLEARGDSTQTKVLGRQVVAALLNTASPDVNYPVEEDLIFDLVFGGLNTGTVEAVKDIFERFNEAGCPLD